MKQEVMDRLTAKTKEQQLMQILQEEFRQPPGVARAILADVQQCLEGTGAAIKPGQQRVMLVALAARHGEGLVQTAQKEVVWTVDAGAEDYEVAVQHGVRALRRQRLQRLLGEAVEQGAVASQEDLARVLQVSVRTIKRDCAALAAQGIYLPTRAT